MDVRQSYNKQLEKNNVTEVTEISDEAAEEITATNEKKSEEEKPKKVAPVAEKKVENKFKRIAIEEDSEESDADPVIQDVDESTGKPTQSKAPQ